MLVQPQVEIPVRHLFTPGLYAREVRVKAGTLVVTKVHLTEHPFVVSQGVILVVTAAGEQLRVEAPYTGVTKAGTRRVGYVVEDAVWTTFHATDLTDPDEIERTIIYQPEGDA